MNVEGLQGRLHSVQLSTLVKCVALCAVGIWRNFAICRQSKHLCSAFAFLALGPSPITTDDPERSEWYSGG